MEELKEFIDQWKDTETQTKKAFIEIMEKWVADNNIESIEFDSNYQLNIEDADTISDKDIVVFIDASIEEIESFYIDKVYT